MGEYACFSGERGRGFRGMRGGVRGDSSGRPLTERKSSCTIVRYDRLTECALFATAEKRSTIEYFYEEVWRFFRNLERSPFASVFVLYIERHYSKTKLWGAQKM